MFPGAAVDAALLRSRDALITQGGDFARYAGFTVTLTRTGGRTQAWPS